jgi:hypothetical protein
MGKTLDKFLSFGLANWRREPDKYNERNKFKEIEENFKDKGINNLEEKIVVCGAKTIRNLNGAISFIRGYLMYIDNHNPSYSEDVKNNTVKHVEKNIVIASGIYRVDGTFNMWERALKFLDYYRA